MKQSCGSSSLPSDRSLDSIGRCRQESLSSVEEDDYDTLDDIDSDKNIVRTKVCVLFPNEYNHYFEMTVGYN